MSRLGARGVAGLVVLSITLAALSASGTRPARADVDAPPPQTQTAAQRAEVAAEAAEATLRLVAPARTWRRLPGLPAGERHLIGGELPGSPSREERAKTQVRAAVWVTRSRPGQVLAHVRSTLPHDAVLRGESSGGTAHPSPGRPGPHTQEEIERGETIDEWGAEYVLPPASDVLRGRRLGVYVARAVHGRFVVRVVADATWEGVRPAYSLLGANVHAITVTNTFAASRDAGPSPVVISEPRLVGELVALVDAIPVFEDKDAMFSCPAFKAPAHEEAFELTFAEQPGAAPLATLQGEPYACDEAFLPVISEPGEPPLELTPSLPLITTIDKAGGLRLPPGDDTTGRVSR